MFKENFDLLPEEKKTIIERAYYSAYHKEISPSEFFAICKKTLTDIEYESLFGEPPVERDSHREPHRDSGPLQGKEEIKTEHIEDIMQYSGIDLKEEADNIVKEAEYNVSIMNYDEEDKNYQIESLFNISYFRDFINKLCQQRNVKITEDGIFLLFQTIKRKILDFTDKMDEASAIRSDAELNDFSFTIDNEISKQLWYLNELEKYKMDKLMIKKDEDQKKKKVIQEREDLLIKKRQSNTVAMAAMGLKQKSWMNLDNSKSSEEINKFSSIYSPFDEKAFESKIKGRIITMKDFLYVLERDKRYNKSIFLIQHYFK
jgi:Transcription initiation factor TFIID component TAF4 family